MPVPDSSRHSNHISNRNPVFLGFCCNNALALDNLQNLIVLMNVGYRARTCIEINRQQFDLVALLGTNERLDVHISIEVPFA